MTLPRRAIEALSNNPSVNFVEENLEVHALQAPPSWGLDRVDQCSLPLDNATYTQSDATGVRVYIIDTGIEGGHSELSNYISNNGCHFDQYGQLALEDGNGHG